VLSPDDFQTQLEHGEYDRYSLNFISLKLLASFNKIQFSKRVNQSRAVILTIFLLNAFLIVFASIFNENLENIA